jgi:hypothetical protein
MIREPRPFRAIQILACVAFLLSSPSISVVHARTWFVSKSDEMADSQTIQGAIDMAQSGDSVFVDGGTYNESIDYLGKDLLVRSIHGAASTIIDGSGILGSCVRIRSGESQAAVLDGFTVTGGSGDVIGSDTIANGGGIFIRDAQPTIMNNVIVSNIAIARNGDDTEGTGGGILCSASTYAPWRPRILSNRIANNTCGSQGGGLSIGGSMVALVENNEFVDNRVLWGDGGGTSLRGNLDGIEFVNNLFSHNFAADHGGGLYAGALGGAISVQIEYNVFWSNSAGGRGPAIVSGGALALAVVSGTVQHNTFAFNSTLGTEGGGLAISSVNSPSQIRHNIIASSAGGGIVCVDLTGSRSTIVENLFWENSRYDVVGCGLLPIVVTHAV